MHWLTSMSRPCGQLRHYFLRKFCTRIPTIQRHLLFLPIPARNSWVRSSRKTGACWCTTLESSMTLRHIALSGSSIFFPSWKCSKKCGQFFSDIRSKFTPTIATWRFKVSPQTGFDIGGWLMNSMVLRLFISRGTATLSPTHSAITLIRPSTTYWRATCSMSSWRPKTTTMTVFLSCIRSLPKNSRTITFCKVWSPRNQISTRPKSFSETCWLLSRI